MIISNFGQIWIASFFLFIGVILLILISGSETFEFYIKPQPSFNKQFDLLLNNLKDNLIHNYKNYLFCSNEQQAKRFHDIFESLDEQNHENLTKQYETIVLSLFQGFIDEENQIVCYTDHQIFERYHKFSIKNGYSKKQTINS